MLGARTAAVKRQMTRQAPPEIAAQPFHRPIVLRHPRVGVQIDTVQMRLPRDVTVPVARASPSSPTILSTTANACSRSWVFATCSTT
jgi:hypothetical protein